MTHFTELDCRMINASILAYELTKSGPIDSRLPNFDKVGFDPSFPPPYGIIRGPEAINAAFVGRTTDNNLVVAIRGTIPPGDGDPARWILDWLNDFRIGQTPWSTATRASYGKVEAGFAAAARDLWPEIKTQVHAFLSSGLAPHSLVVTGHSKGAAVAPLIATLLRAEFPDHHHDIQVRVFAQPLVGDQGFKNAYIADGLNANSKRFQYQYDIVPFLPEYPVFAKLVSHANAHQNHDFAEELKPLVDATRWAYEDLGSLYFMTTSCAVFTGTLGYDIALAEIGKALIEGRLREIAEAHSAKGGYDRCVCGG